MNLNHKGALKLTTDRLIIRKYSLSDADDIYQNWAKDPENTRGLAWKYHESLDETKQYLSNIIEGYKFPNNYWWIIENKDTKECIGSIGLYFVDELNLSAQIGYCIGAKFQHNGYATEAVKKVMEFAFSEVGFNRIEAAVACWNDRSVSVVERCGMYFEGISRQKYMMLPTGFDDFYIYAILKSEYDKEIEETDDLE